MILDEKIDGFTDVSPKDEVLGDRLRRCTQTIAERSNVTHEDAVKAINAIIDEIDNCSDELLPIPRLRQKCSTETTRQLPSDPNYSKNHQWWQKKLQNRSRMDEKTSQAASISFLRSVMLLRYRLFFERLIQLFPTSVAVSILEAIASELKLSDDAVKNILQLGKPPPRVMEAYCSRKGYLERDMYARLEEEAGVLLFDLVRNTGKTKDLVILTELKNIFVRQLPNMARDYITRLVFDLNHFSMCLWKEGALVGGVCCRPWLGWGFTEIAFLAVASNEQVRGYGTRLMNRTKQFTKELGQATGYPMHHFVTFADNYAVGYFEKQGFTPPKELTSSDLGVIKEYDGGTLMECRLNEDVNYMHLSTMLANQTAILTNHADLAQPQLQDLVGGTSGKRKASDLDFLSEPPSKRQVTAIETRRTMRDSITLVLRMAMFDNELLSWPFIMPVDCKIVPTYSDIVENPIDLSTMLAKSERNDYSSIDALYQDVELMCCNAELFNGKSSFVAKGARKIQEIIIKTLKHDKLRCFLE
eukprot:GHVL01010378.1.p1 GENE.GHVL01010378.1~~GHVL01010378.1.p1  ORF type:complete len:529 (+),score=88.13 GHVL01010378.1:60-1646(+)